MAKPSGMHITTSDGISICMKIIQYSVKQELNMTDLVYPCYQQLTVCCLSVILFKQAYTYG